MNPKELLNKFLGCIFSCVVADAFASPYEGPFTKELLAGLHIDTDIYKKNDAFNPGEISVKTLSMLGTIDCYLENKKLDEKKLLLSLKQTFDNNQLKGDIYATLDAVKSGNPAPVGIADNSAALRAFPIGLWNYDKKPKDLAGEAVKNALTTHKDHRCQFGSVVISSAVSFLLTAKKPFRPPAFFAHIANHLNFVDKKLVTHLKTLSSVLKKNPEYVFFKLAKEGNDKYSRYDYGGGISPFVISSVLLSLYYFIKSPTDFKRLISDAIKSAGALSPVAVMCCGLFGAYNGYNSLPAYLVENLIDKEEIYAKAVKFFKDKHGI